MPKLFLILITCFISLTVIADPVCDQHNCMIVVDSGSTGSRAHLYQYQFQKGNTPVYIKELSVQKMSPGLASIGENEDKTNDYLTKLFSKLRQQSTASLPVYFYATAGMRLLQDDKQKVIYQNVKQWFEGQEDFELKSAQTISGHDEGVFGWLAVNYLAGAFLSVGDSDQSFGMMDFGGASMQIALSIDKISNVEKKNITVIEVANKKYFIYVKSFLGLGVNELTHQFLNDKHCFAEKYPLPDNVEGAGDVEQCEYHIELLTNNLHRVNQIKEAGVAQKVNKWFALGALGWLPHSLPYSSLGTSFTVDEVFSLGQKEACQVNWYDLKASSPKDQYLFSTCLASAYYYAIIVNGYGLSGQEIINTKIQGSDESPDWTYGVVIKQH